MAQFEKGSKEIRDTKEITEVDKERDGNTRTLSRIRSRSWFFTWNNYTKNDVAQLIEYFGDWEYVFQEEKGKNGTIHLQGCVRWKNPIRMGFQDDLSNKIHWERCKNWRKAVKYCSKRDTRIGECYTNIKKLKIRKRIIDPMEKLTWFKWQTEIIKLIKDKVDNRKIFWYYDTIGGIGKSTLCKHIVMNYNAILCGGKKNDIFYAVSTIDENKDLDIVLIDVSRQDHNFINYSAIESLKNGLFFSGKYESKMICINNPHIIIFANYPPDYCMLSQDRYVVTCLDS